jgi:hypothetical protein
VQVIALFEILLEGVVRIGPRAEVAHLSSNLLGPALRRVGEERKAGIEFGRLAIAGSCGRIVPVDPSGVSGVKTIPTIR